MSRQSKNRRKKALAQEYTNLHKKGQKGPSSTTPKHGKRLESRSYSRLRRGQKDRVLEKRDSRSSTELASVAE